MRFGSNFRSQLATRIAATIPTIPNSRVEAAGRARAAVAEFAEFAEAVIAPLAPLAEAAVEAAVEAVVEAGAGPAPKTRNRHTALVVTAALGVTAVAATAAYVWWKRREQPLAATLDASNAPDSTDAPDVPPTALHTWPDRGAATAVAESPARDETPPPSAPTPVLSTPVVSTPVSTPAVATSPVMVTAAPVASVEVVEVSAAAEAVAAGEPSRAGVGTVAAPSHESVAPAPAARAALAATPSAGTPPGATARFAMPTHQTVPPTRGVHLP